MRVRIGQDERGCALLELLGATAYDGAGNAFQPSLVQLPLDPNELIKLMIDSGNAAALYRERVHEQIRIKREAAQVAFDPGPGRPQTRAEHDAQVVNLRRIIDGLRNLDLGADRGRELGQRGRHGGGVAAGDAPAAASA